jgi:L-ascorbate metabolism protein UlaG (beta-lactamase superfamily)
MNKILWALVFLGVAMAAMAAPIDDVLAKIKWYGQAGVRIDAGIIIWIDPYRINVKENADLILITHSHSDHYDPGSIAKLKGPNTVILAPADVASRIGAQSEVFEPGMRREMEKVVVEGVNAYNVVKKMNHPKEKNWLGYIITINGVRVYHAGDTERIPEMKAFKADIAMVPLGQVYTMNTVQEAVDSVRDSGAKIGIPIHFGMAEGSMADASKFAGLLGPDAKGIILDQEK